MIYKKYYKNKLYKNKNKYKNIIKIKINIKNFNLPLYI